MASNVQHRTRTNKQTSLVGIALLLFAGFCFGQPAVSLSPKDGPPTTNLQVSGSGFAPYAQIDIYFDSQDQALAVADAAGAFTQIAIQAPKSAVPGNHWVTAVERSGHLVKQEIFQVHANWTEFLTKDMHRENPYENVLNVDNVGSLRLKGNYRTGAGVFSSPAVVNGVVYIGSEDGNVYALDANTGAKVWSYEAGYLMFSSPAVANGVLYVGSYDPPNVCALNARTGAKLWSYATGHGVWSSPAVANGVVYVGPDDANVYALDATTGAKLWSYKTGDQIDGMTGSSPAVANGVVYVSSWDDNIYALDARTGAMLWSYPTGYYVESSPAVANGVVYVGSDDDNVYALNASTGALLWKYTTGYDVESSPAVANGVVYVGSVDHKVYALDASTGTKLGSYRAGDSVDSSPVVVNGLVYVGSEDGNVYAFGLPKGLAKEAPKRPDPKALRPDLNLKVSEPVASTAGTD